MRMAGIGGIAAVTLCLMSARAQVTDAAVAIRDNEAATVIVVGENSEGETVVQASGCCVDTNGLILATAHQTRAEGITSFTAILRDNTTIPLTVLEVVDELDLGLFRASQPLPRAFRIGDASHLRSFTPLYAITTPQNLAFTAAKGMVTNAARMYKDRPVIQSDIPFSQGSSGGPVFDESGALIGIVFGKVDLEDQAVTLVTPINSAYPLLARHGVAVPSRSPGRKEAGAPSGDEFQPLPLNGLSAERLAAVKLYNAGVAAQPPSDKVKMYEAAVRVDPQFYEGWFNLGVAYTAADRVDESIEAYKQAEKIRPDAVEAPRNLGRVLLKVNRLSEVEACFQRAVELAPNDPGAHNDLGEARRQAGQLTKAEAAFRKALELKPDYASAHYNLGLTYAALGWSTNAVASFQDYLKVNPNASDADQVGAWIAKLQQGSNAGLKPAQQGSLDTP